VALIEQTEVQTDAPYDLEDIPEDVRSQLKFHCLGTLDEVQALFDGLGIRSQAVFVKGLFQDTLAGNAPDQIAFLHMDGDWFESTRAILVHLWDRVVPGGVVQLDDYGDWHGCRKAFDEFIEERQLTVTRHPIDGRAVWIEKP